MKQKVAREPYLDCLNDFLRRYSTTQLKINAHYLNIEKGRYSNTPRDQRVCHWCNTSMGMDKVVSLKFRGFDNPVGAMLWKI